MSLIYGFNLDTPPPPLINGDNVGTLTETITFTKYNHRETVKVFNSGIILLGIVTTSARVDPPYDGLTYYDIYSPDGSTLINSIRTQSGNYFPILNKDSDDKALSLRTVYTVPRPCSITARLGVGSKSKPERTDNAKAKAVPPNPVELNVTIYYVKVTALEYGP